MSTLDFKLLKWQREVMTSKARFKVVVAGRRCGKTRFSAIDMIVKGLECTHTDATVLYVAPTYGMAKTLMWDLLNSLAQPVIAKANINDGEITLINGVKLRIRGSDNPDALRGFKLYHVVTDESKDFKLNVWPLIIRPALSDLKGTALIIGTPEPGESEFRDQYELGLGDDPEWASWHFTTLDNELIDPKEIEAARRTLSTAHFAQEYEASFDTMGENIFKESWLLYSPDKPRQGTTFIAVDPAGYEAVADSTKKKHLDNTAIAVVVVTDDGKWWVQKIEYGRWDVRETAVRILMAIRTHKPMVVGVERGALARALMPYLTDLMRKNSQYAHIEQIQITGSKVNRITYNLQGLFEHGRVTLNAREDWGQFKKEYVAFPSKKSHDDCFPAGTPVHTARGVIPIENVTKDDMVLTRNGYRKVLKSWCKGYAQVVTRYGITATPDHRIFTTNRGWVELDKLADVDTLYRVETINETSCQTSTLLGKQPDPAQSERKLNSIVDGITDTPKQNRQTIENITHLMQSGNRLQGCSTEMCGSSITVRSLTDTTFITKVGTLTTTDRETSCACQKPHIGLNTEMNEVREVALRNTSSTLKTSESPQKHGIPRRKDESGTDNMRESQFSAETCLNKPVSSAEQCTNQSSIDRACAVTSASANGETTFSVKHGVPVYDLMVETDHEFFAWGVLVHNCIDSLSLVANLVNTSYMKDNVSEDAEVLDDICGF